MLQQSILGCIKMLGLVHVYILIDHRKVLFCVMHVMTVFSQFVSTFLELYVLKLKVIFLLFLFDILRGNFIKCPVVGGLKWHFDCMCTLVLHTCLYGGFVFIRIIFCA